MRLRNLSLLALLPILAAACGGGDRLTVEQYADFLCTANIATASDLIDPDNITWGDIVQLGEPSIERLRSTNPPEELATFHRITLKALEFVVEEAAQHPPEELANPLAFGLDAIRIATQLRRAIADIPPDTRQTLTQAGCL